MENSKEICILMLGFKKLEIRTLDNKIGDESGLGQSNKVQISTTEYCKTPEINRFSTKTVIETPCRHIFKWENNLEVKSCRRRRFPG